LKHYNLGVIHWYKARCYDGLGKKSEAASNYSQALTYSEKNKKIKAQILADRAQFHAKHGDKSVADADLGLTKTTDPSNEEIATSNLQASNLKSAKTNPTRTAGEEKKTTQSSSKTIQPKSRNRKRQRQHRVSINLGSTTGEFELGTRPCDRL
jgi:hypothetical protein